MTTCGLRICAQKIEGFYIYSVREVYYDENGRVVGWDSEPDFYLEGITVDEIATDLTRMLSAAFAPTVLDITDQERPCEIPNPLRRQ